MQAMKRCMQNRLAVGSRDIQILSEGSWNFITKEQEWQRIKHVCGKTEVVRT